jgi:hypothetical protein
MDSGDMRPVARFSSSTDWTYRCISRLWCWSPGPKVRVTVLRIISTHLRPLFSSSSLMVMASVLASIMPLVRSSLPPTTTNGMPFTPCFLLHAATRRSVSFLEGLQFSPCFVGESVRFTRKLFECFSSPIPGIGRKTRLKVLPPLCSACKTSANTVAGILFVVIYGHLHF